MNIQQATELKARVGKIEEDLARLRAFLQIAVGRIEARLESLEGGLGKEERASRPVLTRPKLS